MKPVIVSGLNVSGGAGVDTLLKLSGSSPIILEKSNLGNCAHCIVADGKGVQINQNVSVQCNDSGIGIMLLGEDQQVTNTQIADCDTGIQVGSEGVTAHNVRIGPENASEYEKNKVQFLRSKVSINVVNGTDNYFHHDNFENAQALYGTRNNVYIKNSSEKLKSPKFLPKTGSENAVDFLNYPDNLTVLPKDSSEVTATIRTLSDAKERGLEVLISSASGYDFYKDAKFLSYQHNGDQYLLTYEMPMTLKQFCQTAVALFHHPGLGTTDNSPVLYLNGPYKGKTDGGTSCMHGHGVLPAPSQNDPGVVSGPTLTNVPAVERWSGKFGQVDK